MTENRALTMLTKFTLIFGVIYLLFTIFC